MKTKKPGYIINFLQLQLQNDFFIVHNDRIYKKVRKVDPNFGISFHTSFVPDLQKKT